MCQGIGAPSALSSFAVHKCVGRGSFGEVLLVSEHQSPDKVYALKVLRKRTSRKELLDVEQRVMSAVSHPFIVQLHRTFETPSTMCLLMEYCAGGELFFHLRRCRRFAEASCQFYIAELTLAFEHMHGLGIIYRDLKPENVLLDVHGHVRLVDFGLAQDGVFDNCSAYGRVGTCEYFAPELLADEAYGLALDWYTLGALTYELLTGLPPFYSKNRATVLRRIKLAQLTFPDYISSSSKDFIASLMKPDPSLRLGADGAAEVQWHRFFADMDFDALLTRRVNPPFLPALTGLADTKYVDAEFTSRRASIGTPSARIADLSGRRKEPFVPQVGWSAWTSGLATFLAGSLSVMCTHDLDVPEEAVVMEGTGFCMND